MSCIDSACLPSGQSKFILKSIVSAIALAASSHAAAQEVAPANAAPPLSDAAAQEIVVTGSRLGRSTFTTPNPVTVLNSEDIEKLGLTNVGDIVAQLPSNSNFFAANNVGLGNFNVGAQLVNLRGLNPLLRHAHLDPGRHAPRRPDHHRRRRRHHPDPVDPGRSHRDRDRRRVRGLWLGRGRGRAQHHSRHPAQGLQGHRRL